MKFNFSDEQFEAFLTSVRKGLDPEMACFRNGINPREMISLLAEGMRVLEGTLRRSRSRDVLADKAMKFAQAKAIAVELAVKTMLQSEDWKASHKWLSTQHSTQWGTFAPINPQKSGFKELGA